MPILQDVAVTLTPEDVIAAQGQKRIRPELLRQAEQAIALGQALWRPQAVYDWFEVGTVDREWVHVSHPADAGVQAILHVGPGARLLVGARRVLVSAGTIGPDLERRVHELHQAGDELTSYLLDCAGVVALGAIGAAQRCLVEEEAATEGWGVGEALSPGSLAGWQLQGQRELCSLLPLDLIGVRLNEQCVLDPQKSFSVLIGLGPGYSNTKVGSVCKTCALRHTCWRRREEVV